MSGKTKIWLIIVVLFVLTAGVVFGGVMNVLDWDFSKLSTMKYEINTYPITENFSNIVMDTDTANIKFVLSDDSTCKVECYEEKKANHLVSVNEDTLVIKIINKKAWYDYIGINFGSPNITVYLPTAEYSSLSINESTGHIEMPKDFKFQNATISLNTGNVNFFASTLQFCKIKTSTGKICVENTSVGELQLRASTGEITVSNVVCKENASVNVSTGKVAVTNTACKNLNSDGSTGNIVLTNVIARENFHINRDTGHIKFEASDAEEIYVETDTGDITGSLLSKKIFITETDTGRINVPKITEGGRCEIKTDTGDIKITINEQ